MKNFMITILLIAIFQDSHAQIFAQKKTRRELLLQQIAALKVYTGYLQKDMRLQKMASIQSMILSMEISICTEFFDSYQ